MSWNLLDDSLVNVLYKEAAFDPDLIRDGFNAVDLSMVPGRNYTADVIYSGGKTVLAVGRGARNKAMVRGGKYVAATGRNELKNKMFNRPANQLMDNVKDNVPESASSASMIGTGDYMNKTGGRLVKVAGLFLKPSDLADHRGLAGALEGSLNGANQSKMFSKEASTEALLRNTRLHGAIIGGVAGVASEVLRKQYTEPTEMPPAQEPKGLVAKVTHTIDTARAKADHLSRKHPVASTLAAAVSGGAAGALMNPQGPARLLTRHKKPNPRL
jgi:hypothetical protein